MDHRLEELSGGEQQRVAVAIALANQPRLLLADEPTGELDSATAKTIYELLRDLNRKLGLTIVIVSHDPGIAQHVDRVVAVRDGKLASESVRIRPASGGPQEETLHTYEELAILDSAGRLTIPREHLDQFHIRRRVRLEIVDEGILIRPPTNNHVELEHARVDLAEDRFSEEADERRYLPAWLDRPRKYFARLIENLRKGTKNAE
jgi:ABC-type methionine transport system ATPase subunit